VIMQLKERGEVEIRDSMTSSVGASETIQRSPATMPEYSHCATSIRS
jgi:hypothetical protein